MAYVGRQLASGFCRPFIDTIFEASSSTIITYARFFNQGASPEAVDIYVWNNTTESRVEIYKDTSLAGSGSFDLLTNGSEIVLSSGDRLEASVTDENAVSFLLCGAEFT